MPLILIDIGCCTLLLLNEILCINYIALAIDTMIPQLSLGFPFFPIARYPLLPAAAVWCSAALAVRRRVAHSSRRHQTKSKSQMCLFCLRISNLFSHNPSLTSWMPPHRPLGEPGGLLGPPGRLMGVSLDHIGSIGGLPRPPGSLLGPPGGLWGASSDHLGASWDHPEASGTSMEQGFLGPPEMLHIQIQLQ